MRVLGPALVVQAALWCNKSGVCSEQIFVLVRVWRWDWGRQGRGALR
jgi:hypothetical protein